MPANDANNLIFRKDGYWLSAYLSIMDGNLIWQGVVSAPPPQGAFNLSVTQTSGNAANIRSGQRIVVEAATGEYKGTINVRYGGTASATNIPVRELSVGEVIVIAGDVIKIYDDLMLVDKPPTATDKFDPDGLAYTGQNGIFDPLPNSGGSWAGWLESRGDFVGAEDGILFDGTGSFGVDPDTVPLLHVWWTTPNGSIDDPYSAAPTISYTEAGRYRIQHQVYDDMPGKPSGKAQYMRVRVHDDDDPPIKCLINWQINPDGGVSTRIILHEPLPLSVLPDFSRVIVWTDKPLPGTHKTGRDHIIADGFIKRDVSETNASSNTSAAGWIEKSLELELVSSIEALGLLPGFSKVFERNETPDAWHKVRALTVKRAMIVLLTRYTNICDIYDLAFDGFRDADYALFFLQKDNPLGQWRELAASRGARAVSDLTGRLEVQGRLELTPLADRAAITITFTLSGRDTSGISVEREHRRTVETFRAKGFTAGATASLNNAAFARAPATPGRGNQSGSVERLIVDDVPDLFAQTAMYGAAADRVFFKQISSGNYEQLHAPRGTLKLPGAYWGMFQNYREFIKFDLPTTITLRGTDLTAFRWQVLSASINVSERSVPEVQVELQAETYAPPSAAVDDTPATSSAITPPPVYIPPWTDTPPTIPTSQSTIPAWNGVNRAPVKVWLIGQETAQIGRSTFIDTDTGAITFEEVTGLGITGSGMNGCSNSHKYEEKLVLTSTGLHVIPDLWAPSPTASLVANNAAMFGASDRIGHKIMTTHNDMPRWRMALSGRNVASVSFDDSGTWLHGTIDGDTAVYGTSATNIFGTCDAMIAPFNSQSHGRIYATYSGGSGGAFIFRSENWGRTWTLVGTFTSRTGNGSTRIYVPYLRLDGSKNINDAHQELYIAHHSNGSTLSFSNTAGATETFSKGTSGPTNRPFFGGPSQPTINVFTGDATRVLTVGALSAGVGAGATLTVSDDGMANYTSKVIGLSGDNIVCLGLNGFALDRRWSVVWSPGGTNTGSSQIWGTGAGGVAYTPDDGTTFINITPAFITGKYVVGAEGDLSDFI